MKRRRVFGKKSAKPGRDSTPCRPRASVSEAAGALERRAHPTRRLAAPAPDGTECRPYHGCIASAWLHLGLSCNL